MSGARAMLTALAAISLLSSAGCTPEVPAMPTYTNDVRPILMAHCVRCHGSNDNTLVTMADVPGALKAPRQCYFQRYGDEGDCTDRNDLAACQSGAGYCGTLGTSGVPSGNSLIVERVTNQSGLSNLLMPPAPSDSLNDWELDVLKRWSTATPAQ